MSEMKSVVVEKAVPVEYDLGNLAVFDTNPLEFDNDKKEEVLRSVARDNTQLLINQILSLPIKKTTDSNNSTGIQNSTMSLIMLPDPTTELPREKPIPKPKPPTKWELFARKKGIKAKGKTGKLVYDEEKGEWVPKWGFKGKNKELDDQWLVEVDEDAGNSKKRKKEGDELIDPRTLRRAERKKLVKKNELQMKRNLLKK